MLVYATDLAHITKALGDGADVCLNAGRLGGMCLRDLSNGCGQFGDTVAGAGGGGDNPDVGQPIVAKQLRIRL